MAEARIKAVITAEDRASHVVSGFGGSVTKMAGAVAIGTLAARGLTLAMEKLGEAGKFALGAASDMEQNRIAFETMLGSAEAAKKMLKNLSDFAVKTPFELPEVVKGAKQLLAYNISAEKILPTFKALGSIAAGVGKDKLPQLVLAFGQVRAATKLTGMELRQFTEAGVPLLEVLAKQSGKTAAQIKEDMENGMQPSFEEVEKAIFSMSEEGGKFYNLLDKQSKTLSGTISNIRDQFTRFAMNIVGISDTGEIRQGSIFARLQVAANSFLLFLNQHRQEIELFFTNFLEKTIAILGTIKDLTIWFHNNEVAMHILAGVIGILGAAFVTLKVQAAITGVLQAANVWIQILSGTSVAAATQVGGLTAAIKLLALTAATGIVLVVAVAGVIYAIQKINEMKQAWNEAAHAEKNANDSYDRMVKNARAQYAAGKISKERLNALTSGKGEPRAFGGPVMRGHPYWVGEKGPEMFVPSQSGQIIPNGRTQANTTNNYNLSVNVGTFVGTEMEKRKLAEELFRAYSDLQSARGAA